MEKITNVLMLGWELPPYHSGGLGRACEGMTRALARQGVSVSFVLPRKFGDATYDWMNVYGASEHLLGEFPKTVLSEESCIEHAMRHQCTLMMGYHAQHTESLCRACFYSSRSGEFDQTNALSHLSHVSLYSKGIVVVAQRQRYDAIHAHEWMTFPAAVLARKVAALRGEHVPFIAHVHATEIDRHDGPHIYNIEKRGMHAADKIVAVSNYTKSLIVKYYDVDPDKVTVVHNGIEPKAVTHYPDHPLKQKHKTVLFLGRVTYQKGPDYYVRLAKRVTDQYPDVKFLMIGSGDMQSSMIELAAREGLTGKLLFSSWIEEEMMDAAYQLADVFVMPSVSEPFGIVPLEAIQNGTPVVISSNSGVAEVIKNCFAVEFWDIERMASSIVTLLRDEQFAKDMVRKAQEEINALTWDLAAGKLIHVYKDAIRKGADA